VVGGSTYFNFKNDPISNNRPPFRPNVHAFGLSYGDINEHHFTTFVLKCCCRRSH